MGPHGMVPRLITRDDWHNRTFVAGWLGSIWAGLWEQLVSEKLRVQNAHTQIVISAVQVRVSLFEMQWDILLLLFFCGWCYCWNVYWDFFCRCYHELWFWLSLLYIFGCSKLNEPTGLSPIAIKMFKQCLYTKMISIQINSSSTTLLNAQKL